MIEVSLAARLLVWRLQRRGIEFRVTTDGAVWCRPLEALSATDGHQLRAMEREIRRVLGERPA